MKRLTFPRITSRVGLALLLGAVVLTALAFGLLSGETVEAAPCNGFERNYYNNAAHTTLVGQVIWPCVGPRETWGQVTSFVEIFHEDCGNC